MQGDLDFDNAVLTTLVGHDLREGSSDEAFYMVGPHEGGRPEELPAPSVSGGGSPGGSLLSRLRGRSDGSRRHLQYLGACLSLALSLSFSLSACSV